MYLEKLKKELATLQDHSKNQAKLINGLMDELSQIHKTMGYIEGTEIYNEKMWSRLTKTHFYQISLFLGMEQTLALRLVSKTFNIRIIGTFQIYQNQYAEKLQLKTFELQSIKVPQFEPPPELIQAQNLVKNITRQSVLELKSLCSPPVVVVKVMGAVLLLLNGSKPENDISTWKTSQKWLNNWNIIDLLLSVDVESITDSLCLQVEQQLEGTTAERCQQCMVVVGQIYGWVQGILLSSQLPRMKANRRKKILELNIQQIKSSLKLFQKY